MKPEPPPLRIASPCPKKWGDMSGDAKRRFCEHCQLHVHNLSAMSERERGEFVTTSSGRACIAYEVHADGSMVTPSSWSWMTVPLRRAQQAAAALLAASLPMWFSACTTRQNLGKPAPPDKAQTEANVDKGHRRMLVGALPQLRPPAQNPESDQPKQSP